MNIENYLEAPVYKSVIFPVTVFGLPHNIFVMLLIITLHLCISEAQLWFAGIFLGILLLSKIITKNDPFFFYVYFEVIKLPEVME